MQCIICHIDIDIDELNVDEKVDCPNHHSVHMECLKEWLSNSKNCPLCSTPYSEAIIDKYKSYFEQKEKEKQEKLKRQLKEREKDLYDIIAEKMVFKKLVETAENLASEKRYGKALDKIDAINDKFAERNKYAIIFLRGKMNYLRGRYDLSINFLFKLVKEKFDYPDAFLYLGKSYQELGLEDKAQWAFDRVPKK